MLICLLGASVSRAEPVGTTEAATTGAVSSTAAATTAVAAATGAGGSTAAVTTGAGGSTFHKVFDGECTFSEGPKIEMYKWGNPGGTEEQRAVHCSDVRKDMFIDMGTGVGMSMVLYIHL